MATEGALGEAYEIRFIILTSPREGGTVCHTGGGGHTGGASREQAQPSRCGADRAGPHGHVALLGVMAEYT